MKNLAPSLLRVFDEIEEVQKYIDILLTELLAYDEKEKYDKLKSAVYYLERFSISFAFDVEDKINDSDSQDGEDFIENIKDLSLFVNSFNEFIVDFPDLKEFSEYVNEEIEKISQVFYEYNDFISANKVSILESQELKDLRTKVVIITTKMIS